MLSKEDLSPVEKKIEEYGMLNYHVLEGMADWVRVVDKEGTIIYANKTMKEHLGDNIVGMKCYKAHCKVTPCTFCITKRSIKTGETVQKEEEINGRYFSVKSSPVTNSNGEVFAAVEVFRDVTRERKLELELIDKNKKMSKDLGFAKRIQEKILPGKEVLENIFVDYIYKPSEMLSGDMFDVFHIDDENIGIYISDVSGHGIAAAMMTMFIRQTMRAIKDDILDPSATLSELYKRFRTLNLEVDKYFTMFYGIFNKTTYEFKYANAGHNCIPIKYNDDGMEMLEVKGYPMVLLFDEIVYDEEVIKLKKGDKILFYTDGITEAKDRTGREFGIESVIDMIRSHKEDILNEINNEIITYSWGEQQDDFALVLMEVIE
ncbi:SpoIIE family protein phosphatase [Tissierella pigra]|uniref:SpoIIE family protein phosphatase n=1 Tax=Tissierella pigra TaxID=2607614 RepID=A0A6N7XH97_9FIRM|nr:SpoIIE family protein phosphatase [Tissierella pigra]MBU5425487.1 SpoIIE family protein phosphatase [Tissierella pigra]MSU01056.1 SpoIIE family protein phosphatase [Tissierella pigra]